MAKNLVLGSILAPLAQIWAPKIFSWILPVLDVRHSCKLSLHTISGKTNEPNLRKWKKTQFWTWFWPIGPKFRLLFFFKKVTRYHGQPSSCIISEKTDDPILRKICDKHTDGCDFIGCYQTNVENPKHKSMKFS